MSGQQPATDKLRTLAVIPARGGSKEIPRKNLSPIGGKPLIAWVIGVALEAGIDHVLVTTDDERIAQVARRAGAAVLMRDPALAADAVTLDPVIHEAVVKEEAAGRDYDLILTIQPTSPLLRAKTVRDIVERFSDASLDTVITAMDDTHLAWEDKAGQPVPAYTARVNRQQLPQRFRETGGVLATRRHCVTATSRIGPKVALQVLRSFEGLDIDTADDWLTAEAALRRRRIALVVIGNRRQGLGHVTRCLTLLESLNAHHTQVFCTPEQDLAMKLFTEAFYKPQQVERSQLYQSLVDFGAQIVIHDELETDPAEVQREKQAGMKVVVFEDLGPGHELADVTFNALYPQLESQPGKRRFFGPSVYCLRDEFLHATRNAFREQAGRILITFGGTDPAGLTFKALRVIAGLSDVPLTIVAGRGMERYDELTQEVDRIAASGRDIQLHRDVSLMSELMAGADIAISSAGRTLYELAHMAVPTVVMAQNEVEMKHQFAAIENGFVFLGLGEQATDQALGSAVTALLTSRDLRFALHERMLGTDLTKGRDFVIRQILDA